jgi:hypothetical protein
MELFSGLAKLGTQSRSVSVPGTKSRPEAIRIAHSEQFHYFNIQIQYQAYAALLVQEVAIQSFPLGEPLLTKFPIT